MSTRIIFFPVGCADCIAMEFNNDIEQENIIIIDSGFTKNYPYFIRPYLERNQEIRNSIDLWIITHTHNDHIGGITKFLKDKTFNQNPSFIQEYWFNWSSLEISPDDEEISVKQGIKLRDYLIGINKHKGKDISTLTPPFQIGDATFTILSPNPDKLEKSKVAWVEKESEYIASHSDYHLTIETLLEREFKEDTSVWNGGSIAFLYECQGKRILFLADCHPSTIVETLKGEPFNCSPSNPLKVDLVKISHHGSSGNTNDELLELLDCRDFAFCVVGGNQHGFPHKECLARIINSRKHKETTTRLLFNDETPTFEDIFDVDQNPTTNYNFELTHLEQGVWHL